MNPQQRIRKLHRAIAPLAFIPLLITVTTGLAYRLSKDWFGCSRDQVHWLMSLHEAEYLGASLEPVYVLLNALGVLWMLGTGVMMLLQSLKKLQRPVQRSPDSALMHSLNQHQRLESNSADPESTPN
jgi:uncharacterized iron-regulated membrane protein